VLKGHVFAGEKASRYYQEYKAILAAKDNH